MSPRGHFIPEIKAYHTVRSSCWDMTIISLFSAETVSAWRLNIISETFAQCSNSWKELQLLVTDHGRVGRLQRKTPSEVAKKNHQVEMTREMRVSRLENENKFDLFSCQLKGFYALGDYIYILKNLLHTYLEGWRWRGYRIENLGMIVGVLTKKAANDCQKWTWRNCHFQILKSVALSSWCMGCIKKALLLEIS